MDCPVPDPAFAPWPVGMILFETREVTYSVAVGAHGGLRPRRWSIRSVPPAVWAATAALPALACGAPYWRQHPVLGVVSVGMSISLAAIGGSYARSSSGNRMGLLLVAAALFHAIAWVASYNTSIWPLVSEFAQSLFFLTIGTAALLFEQRRFQTWVERAWVIQAVITLVGAQTMIILFVRPEQLGYSSTAVWPNVWTLPDAELKGFLKGINIAYGILAVSFVIALYLRWRQLRGQDRRLGTPLLIAAAFLALFSAAVEGRVMVSGSAFGVVMSVHVLQATAATAVPIALFASGAWRRWREVGVAERVTREANVASLADFENSLRRILGIDSSALWVWVPSRRRYIDSAAALFDADSPALRPAHGRTFELADGGDGTPLAVANLPDQSILHPEIARAALEAARPALYSIQSVVNAQEIVRSAQERLLLAEDAGRRQVSRDLHDGVQQRLLAIVIDLARARTDFGPDALLGMVASARHEVEAVIAEIRTISRGVLPPMLVEFGLAGALEEAAESLRMTIDLDVDGERLHPTVELTLYFVLNEALVNSQRHAHVDRVTVRTWQQNGLVVAEVHDNGPGGAYLRLGGGLHGAEDRVQALRGELAIHSGPDCGTTVRVSIPNLKDSP